MKATEYKWKTFKRSGLRQVKLGSGEDLRHLKELDQKKWTVLAASNKGLRFDQRTLELLDTNGDGRVQVPEVLAALDFLEAKGVDLDTLFQKDEADAGRLADLTEKLADLAKVKPSEAELAALKAWEEAPAADATLQPLKEATADADAALAAVEPILDAFFQPPDDAPLVMEGPEAALPLKGNLNPKFADAIAAFVEKAVKPIIGEVEELKRTDYAKVKAAFAPYRAWLASKPVMNANARAALEEEERVVRYRMYLVEYLRNYVSQEKLYDGSLDAMYLTGTLFIDGRECRLCFHVDDEGAHSALAERSDCCIIYLKLTRSGGAARNVCAVITAGRTIPLYAGRNGLFYDRDGVSWDATITKVVMSQVSLREAFWAPWRKMGEMIGEQVKKFVGSTQEKSVGGVTKAVDGVGTNAAAKTEGKPADSSANGAALASSVAALGIGIGMVGAAFAGVVGLVAGLPWWKTAIGVLLVVLAVSLPSVILTWFKLRRRDLGAVLNACGWAVNRPLRFSQKLAKQFTRRACC
jgi:hypothetical protein